MTTETQNNETTRISSFDCDHQPQGTQPETTEERLAQARAAMHYYTPRETFGREHGRVKGWYYTEAIDGSRVSA